MALYSAETIESILFKKVIFGKSASNKTRNPTEEIINTQSNVYDKQVVKLSKYIPVLSPPTWSVVGSPSSYILNGFQLTGAAGVSEYYDLSSGFSGPLLIKVTGIPYIALNPVDKSFYHPAIKNIIPFNFASNYYDYVVRNSSNIQINPTNSAAWYLDPESGTITLFETPDTTSITPGSPPKLDIVVYNGPMGFPDGGSTTGSTGSTGSIIGVPGGSTGWLLWSDGLTGVWRPEVPLDQYREDNFIGVTTISINHNWNHKPYVSILDKDYNKIFLYDLVYNDDNNITVNFDGIRDGIIISQGKISSIHSEGQIIQPFTTITELTINHNWDKNPEVVVYDTLWNEILIYDIQNYTTDSVSISFSFPQSGYVVLSGASWPNIPQYNEYTFTGITGITIPHNYNKKPTITVIDNSNSKIFTYDQQVIDNNNIFIQFDFSTTGTIITQGTFGAKDPHIDRSGRLWEKGENYSIKNRGANVSTGERSLAMGFGNVNAGDNTAIFGENNKALSNRSFIGGGKDILATQDDTFYAPRLSLLNGITTTSPSSSLDNQGITGELFFDDNYIYIKTKDPLNPWKRTTLNLF